MKIRIIKNPIPVGFTWQPPREVEVSDEIGQNLCEDGYAVRIDTPKAKKKDAVQENKQDKPASKPRKRKSTPKGNS